MKVKKRLDVLLTEQGYADTRSKAQAIIMSGQVYVNGQKADKPGVSYEETVELEVRGAVCPYVSRGGLKLEKALRDYRELEIEGLVLRGGGEILAFTLASRLSEDTFDVHFEKARGDIQGAYPAINCEFARYIREKYPEVRYLDREEDMGLEGLRRAKQSYYPHHMVKKYWACLLEEGYEY
jgi:hypothetical protein